MWKLTCESPARLDPSMDDDTHYRLLRLIEAQPGLSQRDLARELGASLGKINYCLNALIEKGWIKARNFRNSRNKLAYAYLLTPRGLEHKAKITVRFLRRKIAEYETLETEIELLRREVSVLRKGRPGWVPETSLSPISRRGRR